MPALSPPNPDAWADLSRARIEELIAASRRHGWRAALSTVADSAPFFAGRLANLGLGNWHLLLGAPRGGRALDVGCGFGALPLGLSEYYRHVTGVEMLPERVQYAALRAAEDERRNVSFLRSAGVQLPFAPRSFDLVTMNGVLEWAALYEAGDPRECQRRLLEEARRVLAPSGRVAVAIENRYAAETLLGLPDTHTGVHFAPVLPRTVARGVTRMLSRRAFRTYLYDRAGYRRLFRDAGFDEAKVLDLVSSYNDYDVVVDTRDRDSYRLLWRRGMVKSFYGPAGRLRRVLAHRAPGVLGRFSYAYLVVGGATATTVLDADHPFWRVAAERGVAPGAHRFGIRGTRVGSMAIATHDGTYITGIIELQPDRAATEAPSVLPPSVASLAQGLVHSGSWDHGGISVRSYQPAPPPLAGALPLSSRAESSV